MINNLQSGEYDKSHCKHDRLNTAFEVKFETSERQIREK